MIPFASLAWEADALAAINRLALDRAAILDPDLYWSTADTVEDLRDPFKPTERLTMANLADWEARCRSAPSQPEDTPNADQPRRITPADRSVPNAAP